MPCEPDEAAATTSKRGRWRNGWTLIRFAERTAVDTVLNKRSLLLLASNRCKPLRSASVRLQGAPRSGCSVLTREPITGLCLSPSSCQTRTSAMRGQTTRATVLFGCAEQPWGEACGHTLQHTRLPLWPLSIMSPKPIRPKWLWFRQPAQGINVAHPRLGKREAGGREILINKKTCRPV